MNPSKQWSGKFGDEYTHRNRVDWRRRIPFWKKIMLHTGARSVHEVGCNAGYNLSAIKRACDWDVQVGGEDINDTAILQAADAGLAVDHSDSIEPFPRAELVFTAGVLIHIPTDLLKQFMQDIIDKSHDYVLCVEYEADKEEEVLYRGNEGMLWRRPYGKMYEEMGLHFITKGFLGIEDGFDNCTYTLLRKP